MSNKEVTLSVVVLSYNNAQYMEDCLNSIANQGIDSYEVFVVDDSSTDNSAEVIREFIKTHPQFELIEKPNSGGAISSQIGIKKARGKYLALVDSDDIVADGAYKKLIKRIEEDDSDYAAGLPMYMVNGFMYKYLNTASERDVFAVDRVLSKASDICDYTRQVFYWNAVYRTDFLRDNTIEMPANLLIADRIFVYKAAIRARRISILSDVVYFWRKKNNEDKISITDQTAEFHMISDRCDSFQAQMKILLEDYEKNIEYTKAIWENSLMRLYYPLYDIADPENEFKDYSDFEEACERCRCFLLQYKALFVHYIANSDGTVATKYITERLLTKNYEDIYEFVREEVKFGEIEVKRYDMNVYNSLIRSINSISFKNVVKENDRVYLELQFNPDAEKKGTVKKIVAYNRYFNQQKIELEYDSDRRRIDITDLSDATFIFYVLFNINDEDMIVLPKIREELSKVYHIKIDNKIYTYNTASGIFTIQRKNRFTLIEKAEDEYYLGCNFHGDIKDIFFFNVKENIRIPVKTVNGLYEIKPNDLPDGDNVLVYENQHGDFTTVRKQELSNTLLDKEMIDKVIVRGKIEFEKFDKDEIVDTDDSDDE